MKAGKRYKLNTLLWGCTYVYYECMSDSLEPHGLVAH